MTFLPIVEREMRVAARRRGTYGMRMKIAGAATLAFAVCFIASQLAPAVNFGKNLFLGLSWLCMVYCLAAGRLMTADCLSREKREGTLGLLFLTDLKGYDVVLGKLAATSLNGFYGLLAVFPLLAIPLLSGGMTNGELWRMAVVLVNTFLFSLAVGLFVSALCRDEQRAMAANFGLILLLAAAPPALDGMIMMSGTRPRPMNHEFFYSCPVYSFWQSADAEYKTSPGHFWRSIGVTFNLTMLLVLLACRVAPRAWQDKPVTARSLKRNSERRRRWWREGGLEKADAFRQRLLNVNAYFWLTARPYLKVSYIWTCMVCMGLWWVFITLMIGHADEAANYGMAMLLNSMLKLWITTEAGHQLAADKKSGAFELLLSTPLTVRDIVSGQWLALRRQFLKPVVLTVILELFLAASVHHFRAQDSAQSWWTWLAGILMLVVDLFTLGWLAMSMALTEKNHDRATLKTAGCILALPWLLFAAVEGATHLWMIMFVRSEWEPDWTYDLGWWFALGFCVDCLFLGRARRRLQTSFRQIALGSGEPTPRLAWLRDWRKGIPEHKTTHRARLRRWAIASAVLLATGAGAVVYINRILRVDLPKPVVVSITERNQPARVFAGQGGFLFIMPDGTLWRWVHPWGRQAGTFQPQQVGTNRDWVQASLVNPNAVALRADGTLWAWVVQDVEPSQIGSEHDWAEARAGGTFAIARKLDGTLWARHGHENLAQVGSNRDWKAISTGGPITSVLALRDNGTLWTWGEFNFFANGMWSRTNYPSPVQVCQESNWARLSEGAWSGARNRAGEWWSFFPFGSLPGADVAASAIGKLSTSNSAMAALGPVFSTNWSFGIYDVRPGGTMWVTPLLSWPAILPQTASVRFGQRSDWISVWSGSGTIVGMTADGTLWTWGIDFGQERHYDLGERFDLAKTAISEAIGAAPRPRQYDEWGGYQPQKEPRPLLQVLLTNSAEGTAPSMPDPHP